MATVIERERPVDRGVIVERDDSGWGVAAIIILAVLIVGAIIWARYYNAAAPASTPNNINVTLPSTPGPSQSTGGTGQNNPTGNPGATGSGGNSAGGGGGTALPNAGGTGY